MPLHLVTDIYEAPGPAGTSGHIVNVNEMNTDGSLKTKKVFQCKYLFLGAGSMGTSELLVKAKAKRTAKAMMSMVKFNIAKLKKAHAGK